MARKDNKNKKRNPWFVSITILAFLLILSMMISGCNAKHIPSGNVAVIPVYGGLEFSADPWSTDVRTLQEWIVSADANDAIQVIVLEINSPGGAPVASSELAATIANTQKPTIAFIREVGASGAYWAASASNLVVANKLSATGSIGVIGSYIEFAEFFEENNITYNRQVAGQYKDIGSPFKEMTVAERSIYQELLADMHQIFIEEVAKNRDLPVSVVEDLATGQIFLGIEAQNNGLVDELFTEQELTTYIEETYNLSVSYARYEPKVSFAQALRGFSSSMGQSVGRGIGESFNTGIRT